MVGSSGSTAYYSQPDVQALANYIQFRLFSSYVAEASEAAFYDPLLLGFVGKLTAIQFIPAAIDYWGDQVTTESLTGTNESTSYPDRQRALADLLKSLQADVKSEYPAMAERYGFKIFGIAGSAPRVSYYGGENDSSVFRTQDPWLFDKEFDEFIGLTPWGPITG